MKKNKPLRGSLIILAAAVIVFFAGCEKKSDPSKTPKPEYILPGSGNVWIVPEELTVAAGEAFTTEIHINSGNQKVASYGIDLTFTSDIIQIDVSKGETGIEAGKDGYVSAVNPNLKDMAKLAGFDVHGTGPGVDLNFLTVHWKAVKKGTSKINITVDKVTDEKTNDVGRPKGIGGTVIVE
ncbi:MAG: hypothetical protein JW881_09045 [Spirochaetales bacterium]|nr:hypothetical protein [Spirochaetales bacterium]